MAMSFILFIPLSDRLGFWVAAIVVVSVAVFFGAWRRRRLRRPFDLAEYLPLQLVLSKLSKGALCTDSRGQLVWFNDRFREMTCLAGEGLKGTSIDQLFQIRDTHLGDYQQICEYIRNGKSVQAVIEIIYQNGEAHWVNIDSDPQHDHGHRFLGSVTLIRDITQQVNDQDRLKHILAAVGDGILQIDKEGIIRECNPAAAILFELHREQLVGRKFEEAIWHGLHVVEPVPVSLEDPVLCCTKTGKPSRIVVHRMGRNSGRGCWLSICTEAIRDATGLMLGVVVGVSNITRERDQQHRLELVIEGGELGTWDWDIVTGDLYVNAQWASMLGYSVDKLEPNFSTFEKLVHPDDLDRAMAALNEHFRGGSGRYQCEFRLRQANGGYLWVLSTGKVTERDDSDRPLRAVGVHVNINARKTSEMELIAERARLTESESKYRLLFEAVPAALFVCDKRGEVLRYNARAVELWGYPPEINPPMIHWDEMRQRISEVIESAAEVRGYEMNLERVSLPAIPVVVNIAPLTTDNQKVDGVIVSFEDISHSKKAEEEIRRSEAKFRNLYDSTNDAVTLLNENGFFDCNEAALKIFGCESYSKFFGLSLTDCSPRFQPSGALSATRARELIERACNVGNARFEWQIRRLDNGELLDTEILLNALEINGQRVVQAVVRDISERVAAAKRQESQKLVLQSVIESDISGYWDWDIANGKEYYSAAWKRMLGYEPDELQDVPETWQSLIVREDRAGLLQKYERHIASRGNLPFYSQVRFRHKSGAHVPVICWGRVIEWTADGLPLRMVGSHVDISQQKRAETELLEAKGKAEAALREVSALRTALDEHSLLSVADRSGKIIDVNTGFCRISGYSREELLGKDHRILNSGEHSKSFWTAVWKLISKGRPWRGEICNRRKDGSLYWVDSTIVPYMELSGRIEKYVSIRFDITAQKAAESALVAAQVQAESANAAKSEFLANMSHEIRTPITAILGFAELLSEDDPEQASKKLEVIDTIRRNGEHLLSVINDILDISKIESGKMTVEQLSVHPVQIIKDIVSLMDIRARSKNLKLQADFGSFVPTVIQSDPIRLRQILINLIANAIKFTEVGSVTIGISCDVGAELLRFDIIDTGIGLTKEQIPRLFESFVQADASTTRKYGGSGLGIRISKRLTEMLGGKITIQSEPGMGSTFTATIATGPIANTPLLSKEEAAKLALENQEPIPSSNNTLAGKITDRPLEGMRILLVEDGPDNQRLISHFLRKAGAEVTIADNGRIAIESLTVDGTLQGALRSPLSIDLMLTDMQMPEMDGYDTALLMRQKHCKIPIIALTAHAMSSDREKCLAAGCTDYASKPIDKSKLLELCQQWSHA